jgi:peptidoglycan/LPS O-acetylase OafA/YrhL
MADPTKKKIFFKNLDGLRAIAATLVFIWHVELHKHHMHLNEIKLPDLGFMGVTIFLVLSGFLITYLLMEERGFNKDIDYKQFYLRRVLRIWPLYFLVLLFGFFIYPADMSLKGLAFSTFFLPNFAILMGLLPAIIDPIWSIGVEEQFYLVQPHLMRIKKPVNILRTFLCLLFLIYLIRGGIRAAFPNNLIMHNIEFGLAYFRFDCLIIGSLTALLFYNEKHKLFKTGFSLAPLYSIPVQIICFGLIIAYIPLRVGHPHIFNNEILTVLTAIGILNLCKADTCIISIDNKVMNYIGKISYGLYLLHKIPLFLILFIAEKYLYSYNSLAVNIFIYVSSYGLSILLASVSYKYFESYFLKLKMRYSKIVRQ